MLEGKKNIYKTFIFDKKDEVLPQNLSTYDKIVLYTHIYY